MADSIPIVDDELLRRAAWAARERGNRYEHPRWVAVMDAFCIGSTFSRTLCRRFGIDPDEKVQPIQWSEGE